MNEGINILRLSDSSARLRSAYQAQIKDLERQLLALLSPSQPAG